LLLLYEQLLTRSLPIPGVTQSGVSSLSFSFLLWPYELSFRFGLLVSIFCFFDYGQNVPSRILEPGNGRTISAHDPLLVRLELGQIVNLEADSALRQLVNRKIDIFHRKI